MALAKQCVLGCFLAVIWIVASEANSVMGEESKFLTPDGKLKGTLEIKDTQEGFAGVSDNIQLDGTCFCRHNDKSMFPTLWGLKGARSAYR
ncbi:MAG TPA: hypothetical protein ACFYD3_02125 [Candidatus Hypogeohydataceae bacterium YC41]